MVAAPVGLDVADQGGVEIRFLIGAFEGSRIGVGRGHGPLGRASRVGAESADHSVNTVPVALGILQAFEYHCRGSLAYYRTIRVRVEGARATACRVVVERMRGQHRAHISREIHCSYQTAIQLALLQRTHRDLQRMHA